MSSSGNHAFNSKTNRRIMPVGTCWNPRTNSAHTNPSGRQLSSSPLVVDVQQYEAPEASPYQSNYVAPAISEGVASSQYILTGPHTFTAVEDYSGHSQISTVGAHGLTVGNVVRFTDLDNIDYSVLYRNASNSFTVNLPYDSELDLGIFNMLVSSGNIPEVYDTQNIGRLGGVTHKPKRVTRIHNNNKTSLIRAGAWNMTGWSTNPTYSNSIASGIKAGTLGLGDTSTGGYYQRLGSGYMTMNIVGNSDSITTYQVDKKTTK